MVGVIARTGPLLNDPERKAVKQMLESKFPANPDVEISDTVLRADELQRVIAAL